MSDWFTKPSDLAPSTRARSDAINARMTQVDDAFALLPGLAELFERRYNHQTDTGAADAYVVTLSPVPASYTAAMRVYFTPTNTNTGASTINVNGLGAKAIKQYDGSDVAAGDIVANRPMELVYDGTDFIVTTASPGFLAAASASASAAATSASNAAASATSASTSATNAAASEAAAAASYDSFDDRYLGPKASAPSLDNDGNALLTGALYWDTTATQMYVYTGSAWTVFFGYLPNGTVGAPTVAFAADTDTGFYYKGAGQFGFAGGGVAVGNFNQNRWQFDVRAEFLGVAQIIDGAAASPGLRFGSDTDTGFYRVGADTIGASVGGSHIAAIDSAGMTMAGSLTLDRVDEAGDNAPNYMSLVANRTTVDALIGGMRAFWGASTSGNEVAGVFFESGQDTINKDEGLIAFYTSAPGGVYSERMRIAENGDVLVAKTSPSLSTPGIELGSDGEIVITRDGALPMSINRQTNDGGLVSFYAQDTFEGNITVSGVTVTYNNFLGSHYSELEDAPAELLRGTIVEATGTLVRDRFHRGERLTRFKVSDAAGSAAVYGVVGGAYYEDDDEVDEDGRSKYPAAPGRSQRAMSEGRNPVRRQYHINALGAGHVRIQAGQTLNVGDLIESAGDGTGRVQADDVIRSRTVCKITSSRVIETFPDGSTLHPCVLYCG